MRRRNAHTGAVQRDYVKPCCLLRIRLKASLPAVFLCLTVFAHPHAASELETVGAAEGMDPAALSPGMPTTVTVSTVSSLRSALRNPQPGMTILISPGDYLGGIFMKNANGTPDRPIIICAADATNPPVFSGVKEGAKLSNCSYVKLHTLGFQGMGDNGINIDDGGDRGAPSHHIILENLTIRDIGRQGNHDALKMSGVEHFVVRDCHIEGWGGSGIDLVGCHQGIIEGCRFVGHEGDRTKNAIQIKGGSQKVLVQTSFFHNAGERALNIGGSTGLAFFRPPNATYEAADVVVAGNRFVGGESHIAWITCQDSHVHHNIFYLPGEWVGRILQETKDRRFVPCRFGLFEDNLIVTDDRVSSEINVGRRTAPSTFAFRHNAWYRHGDVEKPSLPTKEMDGIHGVDPELQDEGTATMRVGSRAPELGSVGPASYEAWPPVADFADVNVPPAEWTPPAGVSGLRGNLVTYVALAAIVVMVAIAFKQLKTFTEGRKN